MDARTGPATAEERVACWGLTASGGGHSDSNRGRTDDGELVSLEDIDQSLNYVRRAHPGAVIVENVCTGWVVLGISALLGEIEGYVWKTGSFDPVADLDEPMAQRRQFWEVFRVEERAARAALRDQIEQAVHWREDRPALAQILLQRVVLHLAAHGKDIGHGCERVSSRASEGDFVPHGGIPSENRKTHPTRA